MESIEETLTKMGLGQKKPGKASTHRFVENYRCEKCQDAGVLYALNEDGSVNYSQTIECECRKEENRRIRQLQLIRMCELPAGTENYTFENFKQRRGLEVALRLSKKLAGGDDSLKWLTLMGGVDCGKTHLAIAICRSWLARGIAAKYAYVPLLLDELRRGYRLQGEDAFDYRFQVYLNVPLLVLDDLGAENVTSWATEKLDSIIDFRAMHGLALVVTTNLLMDELPPRIASRLMRVTFGKVLYINAKEYRLYKAGE